MSGYTSIGDLRGLGTLVYEEMVDRVLPNSQVLKRLLANGLQFDFR